MIRNRAITTIPTLYKNWKVSLEVYSTRFKSCENILHMSTGENVNNHGSRTPGIWTCKGNQIHVRSSVNGNHNYLTQVKPLTKNHWHKINVQQQRVQNDFIYSIRLDDKTVFSITNTQPMVFQNVKVYVSNPWHTAQPGHIRKLLIRTEQG